jgi:hypothetical protein
VIPRASGLLSPRLVNGLSGPVTAVTTEAVLIDALERAALTGLGTQRLTKRRSKVLVGSGRPRRELNAHRHLVAAKVDGTIR